MMQQCGRLRFVLEAVQLLGIEGGGERQHLDGDTAIQRELLRLVNDAHAAAADLADETEIAQQGGHSTHGRLGLVGSAQRARGVRGRLDAQRSDDALHLPAAGQEIGQLVGEFGVSIEELAQVGACPKRSASR